MIASSLAVVALAAMPFSHLLHLHPTVTTADPRVEFVLLNTGAGFRDVGIDGHTYTLLPRHTLTVKAPLGTPVYARSLMPSHRRGDLLLTVTPKLGGSVVSIQ